jgi:hypothetical protein
MKEAELATCRVTANPASPALAVGYIVACMTFYKRGFHAPRIDSCTRCCSSRAWSYII